MEAYRSGESTTALAEAYGCSQNTVIRTVKGLLSAEEYNGLKAARYKGEVVDKQVGAAPKAALAEKLDKLL